MPTSLMNIVATILNKIQQIESNTLKGSYTIIKWDLSRDARMFLFLFYTGVQMINTVVIVSSGQERDSAIHIHVSILPQTPPHAGCHIILSRVPYMQNLQRNHTNELIYKTETDSQTQRMNLWLPGERMGEGMVRKFGINTQGFFNICKV